MTTSPSDKTPRKIAEGIFGKENMYRLWTYNFDPVMPVHFADFDIGAILPPVFYMFGFGHRRGKGKFLDVFSKDGSRTATEKRASATVDNISTILAASHEFEGFDDEVQRGILGDMILAFSLENSQHALGRNKTVQRTAPTHYMASHIDLPEHVLNLRLVPEMIVAMLADQKKGEWVQSGSKDGSGRFSIGPTAHDHNELLRAFNPGIHRNPSSEVGLTSDKFIESEPVGLDQLLTIRIAGKLGQAPDKIRSGGTRGADIPNQRPIAEQASKQFSEDMRRFIREYASQLPRQTFIELLESCMAIGLTTILRSVASILFEWGKSGKIPVQDRQVPLPIFVDCSEGIDKSLRHYAENSMQDLLRQIQMVPSTLMAIRLLDFSVDRERRLRDTATKIVKQPYATEYLDFLGSILLGQDENAERVLDRIYEYVYDLAQQLKSADNADQSNSYQGAIAILNDDEGSVENPVWRLAEALNSLMGRGEHVEWMLRSALMRDKPNGIGISRRVRRKTGTQTTSKTAWSTVLTNPAIDYLVYLLVLPSGSGKNEDDSISLNEFIKRLQQRFGLFIDETPPGYDIPRDVLRNNRVILEKRLRNLGLLHGVNDAESMKRLRPSASQHERVL